MKKKTLNKNGVYFSYFSSPIDAFATSSRINNINGSRNDCNPFGALPSRFLYEFAIEINIQRINARLNNNAKTFFVIEKSKGKTCVPSSSVSTIFPLFSPSLAIAKPLYDS